MGVLTGLFRKPPNFYTIVAAVVSIGSFATTYAGFDMFFGNWGIFAFFVALVVQIFLFHFSMEFGRLLNGELSGVVPIIATLFMLPVTFIVSFGFSAVFFWDSVFTGEQEQRAFTTNIQSEVAALVEQMGDDRALAGDAALADIADQVSAWEASVFQQLDRIAGDNQANIETIIGQQITAKKADIDAEKEQRAELIETRTGTQAASQEALREITSLQIRAQTLEAAINETVRLRAEQLQEKTDAENEAQAELEGTGDRAAGEGPLYDAAVARAAAAQEEADRLTGVIDTQQAELVDLQSEITRLELSAGNEGAGTIDDSEFQRIDARIAELEREVRDLEADLRLQQSEGEGGNSGFINILKNQPTTQAYQAALGRCNASIDYYREQGGTVAQQAAAITCQQPSLERSITDLEVFQANEAEYLSTCGTQSDRFRAIDTMERDDVLTYGQNCLNLAQLSIANAQNYRTAFGAISRDQDEGAFLFTRAGEAWRNGENTLMSSIYVAFGIDLLIFIAGYLATQKKHVRVTKNLRGGELSDILHQIWQVDFMPKPEDPNGILLAKLVISQLTPIPDDGTFVREMNLTEFSEKLEQAEMQGMRRGLKAGFNVGFGEWIRKFGKIEERDVLVRDPDGTLTGEKEKQNFLKVREEFINYFAKQVYDYESSRAAGAAVGAAAVPGARRLAAARPDEDASRYEMFAEDAEDDYRDEAPSGKSFSAKDFAEG